MPSETPEILQCVSWSVHWRQDIYLGDTAWLWDDEPPGSLMFAFHPDTGPGSGAATWHQGIWHELRERAA